MAEEQTGRVVIGIDPAKSSGLALWRFDSADLAHGRMITALTVETEAAGSLDDILVAELDRAKATGWASVVEKIVGWKGRPCSAQADEVAWRRALTRVAQARAEAAGVRYRKPCILRPQPATWRAKPPKGIGLGRSSLGGQELKRRGEAYAAELGVIGVSRDATDAVCLAAWGAQQISQGLVPFRWVP